MNNDKGDNFMYICSETRMKDKLETMSQFGDTGNGGVTRYTLSTEDLLARNEFVRRMESIGCTIKTDDLANIYAILPGSDPTLPGIFIASHSDSVRNGGNYDGILGVVSAMEVLETVVAENIPHQHNFVAMIWTNEEGSLYFPTMMGSGVVCNPYLPESIASNYTEEIMLKSTSFFEPDITFAKALEQSGFKGSRENRFSAENALAMFELHIEQGPILESNANEIGVVTCVLGMLHYRIQISGQSDHAGTTPMPSRQDALYGAAQAIIHLHQELDQLPPDLVYTTGQISCHPNIHTVIPDFVEFSLDTRHESEEVLEKIKKIMANFPKKLANCEVKVVPSWSRETVYFDEDLVGYVESSTKELGYRYQKINSGAGHDAQFAAYVAPTTMIFVPSKDGHSHCELEYTSLDECTKGATVLLNAVLKCDHEK